MVAYVLMAGCAEPHSLTRVYVSGWIDADSEVRELVSEVEARIETRAGETGPWRLEDAVRYEGDAVWPLMMRVGPVNSSGNATYQLLATARDENGSVLVQARALGSLQEVRKHGLRVLLERSCLRRATLCGAGSSCTRGACVDAAATPDEQRAPTASPSEPDAAVPPAQIATADAACDEAGARACGGFETRTPLLCSEGSWKAEPECSPSMRCDSSTGMCRAIAPECKGHEPEMEFCTAGIMRVCNRDLTASTIRACGDNELCVTTAANQARCECSPGFVRETAGCTRPTGCERDNGGCDALTTCSPQSGGARCGACPTGYAGRGDLGCSPQLLELTLSEGELTPAFDPEILAYRVRVPVLAQHITLRARGPAGARITSNGAAPNSDGSWTSPLLMMGDNAIALELSTESGGTRKYELIVERSSAQRAYIKPPRPSTDQVFSYALQASGDTVVVGAPADDSAAHGIDGDPNAAGSVADSGAAWIYVRKDGAWLQQAFLKPDEPAADDMFGSALALSGDTLVVGSPRFDVFNLSAGSARAGMVYVYVRKDGAWTQQARFSAEGGSGGDMFGYSVALEGDTLAVGANLESSGATASGAVYVYTREGASWKFQQKLKASEPRTASQFGSALAISDQTLVVSAGEESRRAGAVYVFAREGGQWKQRQRLTSEPASDGAMFGFALSLTADRLAIGAPRYRTQAGANASGQVYVYERAGGSWNRTAILQARVPLASDYFGTGVVLHDATLLVGSSGDTRGGRGLEGAAESDASGAGAAYVFAHESGTWELTTYLKAKNAGTDDDFGLTVGIAGAAVVVGAMSEDNAAGGIEPAADDAVRSNSGALYIFE
ncbi:MAG TPA: cadherin-like beta sandwich domain-containing protein [Polyangiales bacterium]|nr:cadherin-like beta sandwich domain-containing protein [Polyangiales bacterium]